MIKYTKYILLAIFIYTGCSESKTPIEATDFIYLEGKQFKHKEENYFPLMLNYSVNIFENRGEFMITPMRPYENPSIFEHHTKDENNNQVLGHLKLIKEMGFNTVRLCTDSNFGIDWDTEEFRMKYYTSDNDSKWVDALSNSDEYFRSLQYFFELAESQNIRIMLLIRAPMVSKAEEFTRLLLQRFSNTPIVFSYDFMNEPLYFDNSHLKQRSREKQEAYKIVYRWKMMMEKYAPNQLLTIGFSEPIEVLEWDPSILPVDFVQFHTYNPLRVPSEIYWYANYVGKPWIIGETSLPADNDSVFYEEQRQYMVESYKKVVDCGGSGFGWWGFQEVRWGGFEHDYTSLLNLDGVTATADSQHTIIGTVKPAALEVKSLYKYKSSTECSVPINYKNMIGYDNFVLTGRIVDENTGDPIEGAVIRGWTQWFKVGLNTYTNSNGEFSLYSNDSLIHFAYSAPGMTCVKEQQSILYKPVHGYNQPMDSLKNKDLEYQNISYLPFLVDRISDRDDKITTDDYIFNFKPNMFDNAKFEGSMGTLKLEPLNLKKHDIIESVKFKIGYAFQ